MGGDSVNDEYGKYIIQQFLLSIDLPAGVQYVCAYTYCTVQYTYTVVYVSAAAAAANNI